VVVAAFVVADLARNVEPPWAVFGPLAAASLIVALWPPRKTRAPA
jgi:hypothetical protein